jgi:hypothetical protein
MQPSHHRSCASQWPGNRATQLRVWACSGGHSISLPRLSSCRRSSCFALSGHTSFRCFGANLPATVSQRSWFGPLRASAPRTAFANARPSLFPEAPNVCGSVSALRSREINESGAGGTISRQDRRAVAKRRATLTLSRAPQRTREVHPRLRPRHAGTLITACRPPQHRMCHSGFHGGVCKVRRPASALPAEEAGPGPGARLGAKG